MTFGRHTYVILTLILFPAAAHASGWELSKKTDPITDLPIISMDVASTSGVNQWGEPIYLIIRCKDKDLSVIINWGQFIDTNPSAVTLRWGKNKAETEDYSISSDGTASFIYDQSDDIAGPNKVPVLGGLMVSLLQEYSLSTSQAGTGLAVQVEPYQSSPITAVFDLSGFQETYRSLGMTCGVPATLSH